MELSEGAILRGRYRIARKLGAGGMGAVYLAERVADRVPCVIKTIHGSWAEHPDSKKRFAREAEAASLLDHPGVVRVFELQMDADPPFIAMEHLSGRTLAERIKEPGHLAVAEAVAIIRELLAALAVAHARGIVHRDLKPANVMLVPAPGGGETVKVLDFGIARIFDEIRRTRLTHTGQVLGTPGFLAPEQAKGDPIDARTDLFAVGVILYLMLAEKLPFPGRDTSERLIAMLTEAPAPLRKERPDVPEPVAAVIARCLEKEPNDRYASAVELASALDDALAGRVVESPPTVSSMRAVPTRALAPPTRTPVHEVPATAVGAPAPRATKRGSRLLWPAVLLAVLLVGTTVAIGGLSWMNDAEPAAQPTVTQAQGPLGVQPIVPTSTVASPSEVMRPASGPPETAAPAAPPTPPPEETPTPSPSTGRAHRENRSASTTMVDPVDAPNVADEGGTATTATTTTTTMNERPPETAPPPTTEGRLRRSGLPSQCRGMRTFDARDWVEDQLERLTPCFEGVVADTSRSYLVYMEFESSEVSRARVSPSTNLSSAARHCIQDELEEQPGFAEGRFHFRMKWEPRP